MICFGTSDLEIGLLLRSVRRDGYPWAGAHSYHAWWVPPEKYWLSVWPNLVSQAIIWWHYWKSSDYHMLPLLFWLLLTVCFVYTFSMYQLVLLDLSVFTMIYCKRNEFNHWFYLTYVGIDNSNLLCCYLTTAMHLIVIVVCCFFCPHSGHCIQHYLDSEWLSWVAKIHYQRKSAVVLYSSNCR